MNGIQEIIGNFAWLDWRAAVVLCIVVTTIYFVVMVLRFLQLPRHDLHRTQGLRAPEMRTPPPEFDARPGTALAGIWESPPEPRLDGLFGISPQRRAVELEPEPASQVPSSRTLEFSAAEPQGAFAAQLSQKTLQVEMRQLQEQLAESRAEILRLREEMGRLSAAQKVSPLYNEAMGMAVRGVDAAGIAGRCGISIAEAELVVALSRRPDGDEREEEDGGYGRRA